MKESIRVVYEGGTGEVIEKKSKFIATVRPIDTEEEALEFIERLKKKYWDATHNCYAYVLGDQMEIQRFSDDGEPSGTAGKPMLEVLLGEEVHNAAVVVTRYFGGTLLGTGGLVRTYGRAVKAGLENSVILEKTYGVLMAVYTDYNGLGKIQYQMVQKGLDILNTEYTQEVVMRILIPKSRVEEVKKCITEVTGGRSRMEIEEELYFGKAGKEPVLF